MVMEFAVRTVIWSLWLPVALLLFDLGWHGWHRQSYRQRRSNSWVALIGP